MQTEPENTTPAATGTTLLPWNDLAVIVEEHEEGTKLERLPEGTDAPEAAAMDALASQLLRAHAGLMAEVERYRDTERREAARLSERYAALCEPLRQRIDVLEGALLTLAKSVRFPGKSRSRKVGYGSYGLRKVPGKPTIIDQDAALAWAKENLKAAVRAELRLPLSEVPEALVEKAAVSLLPSVLYAHVEASGAKMTTQDGPDEPPPVLVTAEGEPIPGVVITEDRDTLALKHE